MNDEEYEYYNDDNKDAKLGFALFVFIWLMAFGIGFFTGAYFL